MVRIKVSGVPIDMPFEPYPAQMVAISKLISCLTTGTSGLIESPTGTGKSLSIICAVLGYKEYLRRGIGDVGSKRGGEQRNEEGREERLKIIICSRTHKQLDQLVEQLRKTQYRPRMSILASRSQYCISPKLVEVVDKNGGCDELVKSGGCMYFGGKDRLAKRIGDRIFDIEEAKGEGRRCGGCPYYASRILNEDADVIFAPYNYLIDGRIRENIGLRLENSVVIIDEAHNIEDVCRSSGSIELTSRTIDIIQNEMVGAIKRSSLLGEIKVDFVNVMDLFRRLRENSEKVVGFDRTSLKGRVRIRRGKEIKEELERMGITKEFVLKFKNSIYAIQRNEEAKSLVSMNTFHVLEGLDSVMSSIQFSECDAYGFVFQKAEEENVRNTARSWYSYNFWLLDAGYTFKTFVGKVRSLVLLSGTLTPFTSFSSELGHKFEHSVVAPHLVSREQVFVSCVRRGHLQKELVGTYAVADTAPYLDQLSRIVVDVSGKVKPHGGALVFVPSYTFLEKLQRRMEGMSVGSLFVEPKSGSGNEFEKVLQRYRSRVERRQGAVLMCVYRGKASEGIDFRDSSARAVVAIGIPYPSLHDPQVELKKEFNDKYKSFNGRLWYETQAFRAVNQAVGRAIRHRDDWGVIMFLDSRYSERRVQNHLCQWVGENLRTYESYEESRRGMEEFLSSKRAVGGGGL